MATDREIIRVGMSVDGGETQTTLWNVNGCLSAAWHHIPVKVR